VETWRDTLDQQVPWTMISMPTSSMHRSANPAEGHGCRTIDRPSGANTRVCHVETLLDARTAFNISHFHCSLLTLNTFLRQATRAQNCKFIEEFVMWRGPLGCSTQRLKPTPASASVSRVMVGTDQGPQRSRVRRERTRRAKTHRPLRELFGEPLSRDTSRLLPQHAEVWE